MEFSHEPVLLSETIDALNIREGGTYIDCTTGGGGHSSAVCAAIGERGRMICIDRDPAALEAAGKKLAPFADRVTFVRGNFCDLASILAMNGVERADGILCDLGVSSHQLDTPERGFSYIHDAPLDMRMDPDSPLSAYELVNESGEEELASILFEYGEEKLSRKIASAIVKRRQEKPIARTSELSELVASVYPPKARHENGNPAKRTFQALRIAVNRELDAIGPMIEAAKDALVPGGRLAVITFHSLEDRIVKQSFAALAKGCTCPPEFPVCVCGKKPQVTLLKPVAPGEEELNRNPRSHSARLRAFEKL